MMCIAEPRHQSRYFLIQMWNRFIQVAAVKIVAVELILIQYLAIHIRSTSRFICSDIIADGRLNPQW